MSLCGVPLGHFVSLPFDMCPCLGLCVPLAVIGVSGGDWCPFTLNGSKISKMLISRSIFTGYHILCIFYNMQV